MHRTIGVLIVLSILLASAFSIRYSLASSSGFIELPQEVFATLQRAVDITWNGNSFIGSDRANLSSASLVAISGNGKTVFPFAPSFSTKNGSMEDYVALSPGQHGFPAGFYFVLSFDSIYKIDSSGDNVELFSVPVKGQQLSFIAFDAVGTWGYNLLALYTNGMIWAVNANGSASQITTVGVNQNPECITVAPQSFGNYGGDLLVSEEIGNHSIVAISPTNKSLTFLARYPAEAPERVFSIVKNEDLYLGKYDQGVIMKYPAADFANLSVSSILVVTEGENGQNGSIDVLSANGSDVSSTTILLEKGTHFEGMTYSPPSLNGTPVSTSSSSSLSVSIAASSAGGSSSTFSAASIAIIAVAIIAIFGAIVFVARRRR